MLKSFFFGPKVGKFQTIKKWKVEGSDLVHLYEDGTKLKIPYEITTPLFKIMIGMACNFLLDPALLVSLL